MIVEQRGGRGPTLEDQSGLHDFQYAPQGAFFLTIKLQVVKLIAMKTQRIEKYTMQRDGSCRPCGKKIERGDSVIRTAAYGGQDSQVFICMACGREIAKIALEKEDLDEFGQEMVMEKLLK